MTNQSRAYTPEEVRDQLYGTIKANIDFWLKMDDTERLRMEGLAFSILNIFDGTTIVLPAMDIVLSPHPDDKQFHIDNDEKWYEPGQVINDCMMHEEWYKL